MALIFKNKIGFLTGTIPTSDVYSPSYPSWERCNTLVMSWLLNSLSPPIAQSVIFLNRVVDIWTDLRKCFLKRSIYLLFRSQILLMDPFPPVNHVLSMIIQQERHNSSSPITIESNTFVNVAQSTFGRRRGRGVPAGQSSDNTQTFSNKKCIYCGRNGHAIDICYAKHGYPLGHP
ncbi:hypothetical protein GYH30_010271 [Glycine max]|uniref:Retrotransposon Copia-like N-terminal domain-containing protein n=1 Tax=Glycine max TaxID=3847 RepID=A0A0R0KKL3_SOYBN|nr:hypothetical protein GYH30_010271 [Glycine max]